MISWVDAPGVKSSLLLQLRNVLRGYDAAAEDGDVIDALLFEQGDDRGKERHVRSGEDAEPDGVDILLHGGLGDHLRRLMETGVDDLEAGVTQGAGDDLGATIVAVEAGLGNQDA
jgi:hypothetical protein